MGKSHDLNEGVHDRDYKSTYKNSSFELTSISGQEITKGVDEKWDLTNQLDEKNGRVNMEDETAIGSDVKPGSKDDPFRMYRYAKQSALVGVWICLGLSAEIVGPTIPDLTERLCVNYEDISRALLGRNIGAMLGSLAGGFINEILYRQSDLLMSVNLFLMSVACACLPLVDSLGYIFTMLLIMGFAEGIINTGGNALVMHLWGESAPPHIHTLHFGFGFGALLAPLIARPFLSPEFNEDSNYTVCDDVNGTTIESESQIEIAYAIIGCCVFVFSLVMLTFHILGSPQGFPLRMPNRSLKKLLSANSCSRGYTTFAIILLILLCFYYIQTSGGSQAFGKFLFSFAVESELQFSKDEASYLQSAYWASYTFGRLLAGPIAKCVSVNHMIIGDITGNLVTAIILAIWATSDPIVMWVFTCFMGFFIGPIYPNGMAWSNIHLDMNSMSVMLLSFSGQLGGFIYTSITGSLFENVGPETLMYIMVVFAAGLGVVYSLMQTTVYCHVRYLRGRCEEGEDTQKMESSRL